MFYLMQVSRWHRRVRTAVIALCVGAGGSDLTACGDPWQHSVQLSFYYLLGRRREDERRNTENSMKGGGGDGKKSDKRSWTSLQRLSLTEGSLVCEDVRHIG